jgi:hypothetical protein
MNTALLEVALSCDDGAVGFVAPRQFQDFGQTELLPGAAGYGLVALSALGQRCEELQYERGVCVCMCVWGGGREDTMKAQKNIYDEPRSRRLSHFGLYKPMYCDCDVGLCGNLPWAHPCLGTSDT